MPNVFDNIIKIHNLLLNYQIFWSILNRLWKDLLSHKSFINICETTIENLLLTAITQNMVGLIMTLLFTPENETHSVHPSDSTRPYFGRTKSQRPRFQHINCFYLAWSNRAMRRNWIRLNFPTSGVSGLVMHAQRKLSAAAHFKVQALVLYLFSPGLPIYPVVDCVPSAGREVEVFDMGFWIYAGARDCFPARSSCSCDTCRQLQVIDVVRSGSVVLFIWDTRGISVLDKSSFRNCLGWFKKLK